MGTQQRLDLKNKPQSDYIQSLFTSEDGVKSLSRDYAQNLKLGSISLSQNEGSLLSILVGLSQARKFVEIGTLTGLSAQYIFQALPEGSEFWTFEKNKDHVEKAKAVFSKLLKTEGLLDPLPNGKPVWTFFDETQNKKIHLVNDDAEISLFFISQWAPFDGVFIDGNKSAYVNYLDWTMKHLKKGGLLLADNVFLSGTVWGEKNERFKELQVQVMREFNDKIFKSGEFFPAMMPTPDGMLVALYTPQEKKNTIEIQEPSVPFEPAREIKDEGTSHV